MDCHIDPSDVDRVANDSVAADDGTVICNLAKEQVQMVALLGSS